MMTMILVAATTKIEMMIGVPEVAIRVIKGHRGCGNLSGGGRKRGRLQGGARRIDPDVNELVTIKVCLSQFHKLPDQP